GTSARGTRTGVPSGAIAQAIRGSSKVTATSCRARSDPSTSTVSTCRRTQSRRWATRVATTAPAASNRRSASAMGASAPPSRDDSNIGQFFTSVLGTAGCAMNRAAFPHVRVVPSQGPPGVASARNTGTREARAELVAFIDDDARADPAWLAEFAPWYEDPRVVGVGGVIEPRFATEPPTWLPRELQWVVGASYADAPTDATAVRNRFGSNMSFR